MKEVSQVNIAVRPLKLSELKKLLYFRSKNDYEAHPDHEAGREPWFRALLKACWYGKRMATLLALRDGEIVGYITLVFGKYKKFRGNAYLVSAAVKANERGKGIGSRLFRAVENFALSSGARRIELEVFAKNIRALELYKRLGYEVEGVKRRAVEFEGGYDDLIFLAKLLKEKQLK